MKKLLVLFIILIVLRPLHAQLKIHTNMNMRGDWNSYTEKYSYGEKNVADITFSIWDTYISADDKSRSVYRIINKSKDIYEDEYKIFGWDCYDERNVQCRWSIIKYYSQDIPDVITIIYPKIAYMYFISEVEKEK
jgi:hypothetical protein